MSYFVLAVKYKSHSTGTDVYRAMLEHAHGLEVLVELLRQVLLAELQQTVVVQVGGSTR